MSTRLPEGEELDPTRTPIEAVPSPGENNDSAYITQLRSGNYIFVHEQPDTNGVGMVLSPVRATCEEAARRARYRGEPSTVAARMGLTESGDERVRT
jgi:hypothetical protein